MHRATPKLPYRTYYVGSHRDPVTLHEPPPDTPNVPEALVQDLWMHQRFDTTDLSTSDDEPIRVLDPGRPNTDAGPDFQNAHLRIGPVEWRGHVEVHTTSAGWFEHGHHTDPRYDSVILHVTLHADVWTGGLLRADETPLPELVLFPHLETPLRELLHAFHTRADDDALPCAPRWNEVPDAVRREWIATLAKKRIETKRNELPDSSDASFDAVLHQRLLRGLGYSKNEAPMQTLARRVRPEMLRAVDDQQSREALLLGTAGLLPEPGDLLESDRKTADYAMNQRDRFRRLQVRFDLDVMESTAWTFFRLRPNNFPPLRIAQAAAWYRDGGLLSADPLTRLQSSLRGESVITSLRNTLSAMPSGFWHTHYHLTKKAAEHDPSLGRSRIDTLLVNAVAPVLLRHADRQEDEATRAHVFDLLSTLPPSRDHVVRRYADLGTEVESALDAQGLHELYRSYCTEGGCLDCAIGKSLLEHEPE